MSFRRGLWPLWCVWREYTCLFVLSLTAKSGETGETWVGTGKWCVFGFSAQVNGAFGGNEVGFMSVCTTLPSTHKHLNVACTFLFFFSFLQNRTCPLLSFPLPSLPTCKEEKRSCAISYSHMSQSDLRCLKVNVSRMLRICLLDRQVFAEVTFAASAERQIACWVKWSVQLVSPFPSSCVFGHAGAAVNFVSTQVLKVKMYLKEWKNPLSLSFKQT